MTPAEDHASCVRNKVGTLKVHTHFFKYSAPPGSAVRDNYTYSQ